MWTKNIKNAGQKKSTKGLLDEALAVHQALSDDIKKRFPLEGGNMLSDRFGRIGYETRHYILVAKSYPYGDIVSVHKNIWDRKKKIVMYIASSGYFYGFNPEKITEIQINKRGDTEMVNFSIRTGVNIMKMIELEKLGKEKAEKNEEYLKETFQDLLPI